MLCCVRCACTPRQILFQVHIQAGRNSTLGGHRLRQLGLTQSFSGRLYASKAISRAPKSPRDVNNQSAQKPAARSDVRSIKPVPPTATSPVASTKSTAPPTPVGANGYPEQILIYHAGTGRTIFISCFKLTAIFIFIWSAVLIAPGYYFSPLEPDWKAAVAVLGGAVPLVVMVFTTAPFVTYVHLALPLWARASRVRLMRYAQNLPSSAIVDITSLRWIWPRVTRLHASELYIHKNQVGAMTIRRNIPQAVKGARRWWQWRPLSQFYVAGKTGRTTEKGVWEEVVECIAKHKVPTAKARSAR